MYYFPLFIRKKERKDPSPEQAKERNTKYAQNRKAMVDLSNRAIWHRSRVDIKGLFRSTLVLIRTALLSILNTYFRALLGAILAWKLI